MLILWESVKNIEIMYNIYSCFQSITTDFLEDNGLVLSRGDVIMSSKIYFKTFNSDNDYNYWWALASNEETMKMNYGRAFTRKEAGKVFNRILEVSKSQDSSKYFKVFDKETKYFIGMAALIEKEATKEVEIEYMFLPQYWGRGYGSKTVKELLDMAKELENINRVTAIIDPSNERSAKILLKNGFQSQRVFTIDDGSSAEVFTKNM